MNEPPVQQHSARTVYRNRWMTVSEHRIRRSDATEGIYGLVDKPDFALIIPVEGDGFHLVTQYRYPTGEHSLEFPQGTSESETFTPDELAQAELIEELGLRAGHIEHLGTISPAPGTSSQRCNVFVATQLEPDTSRDPDPEEHDLRHQWLTRDAFESSSASARSPTAPRSPPTPSGSSTTTDHDDNVPRMLDTLVARKASSRCEGHGAPPYDLGSSLPSDGRDAARRRGPRRATNGRGMSSSTGSSASSAHDRYRQAITELTLHGGRVAELAEIVDRANDEMLDTLVAQLFKLEAKSEAAKRRLRSLEEAVAELKRG